ncbi:fungal zn(2)-Cys(6) binuclear cluster domain-containing protein [Rhizoctonia solani AG-1 IA]|uniref:Fungal zn(2)-Cys(6) binuclear cluster domain-containing protein n=1 Tax=Thanatephorus cucumeris (strain AG1-IA) TaxID=983506 RepID=L8WVU4_THACA|nr:fungal zn(2)-Cys(6) binuclear cluster domain-containing protein [Rhizoctonia solani AG-1 IA]
MSFEGGVDRGVKRKGPATDVSDDNEPKARGRACTACRAIKVRCDNPNIGYEGPCSRCTRLSLECLYQEKKRGRKPKNDNPDDKQQQAYIAQPKVARTSSSQIREAPNGTSEFSSVLEARAPRPLEHRTVVSLPGSTSTPPYGTAASPSLTVSSSDASGSRYRDLGPRKNSRDDVKKYTLANIMSDTPSGQSRPDLAVPPPVPLTLGLSSIDRLEDPLKAEFVTEAEVDSLFYSYFAHLNSIIGLLDPRLHTAPYVRRRSTVLYTTIISVSSKFFLPRVHQQCHALSQSLIGRALASDMCNIEYIQALSLSTFYKDADDASSWRKVGLAIRMAYELNLHEFRTQPLPKDELEARKQLVSAVFDREQGFSIEYFVHRIESGLGYVRFFTHAVCPETECFTESQRNKPNMVPDHDLPDVEGWVRDHPQQADADAQLAGSFSFLMVYRLIQATRSSMMSSKPGGFDATIRHLFRMLDGTPKFWATLEGEWIPCSACTRPDILHRCIRRTCSRFKINNECKDSAALVLKHVVEDMAPSGYIPYTQDGIAFATAYAGVWLYKHLSRFEPGTILEIVGLFKGVVEACEKQSQQPKDIPSYFARFFSHLARNSESVKTPIQQMMSADRTQPQSCQVANALFPDISFPMADYQEYVPPELMPPLDGMDAHWCVITFLSDSNFAHTNNHQDERHERIGRLVEKLHLPRFTAWLFHIVNLTTDTRQGWTYNLAFFSFLLWI